MKKIYLLSILFLIIDFLTKLIIKTNFQLYQSIPIIPNFFSLTYVINQGAAFSILEGKQLMLSILAIGVIILILKTLKKQELKSYKIICYSLLIGGILGNLVDRLIYKGVVDFLDFKLFNYQAPIFNLADCFIVISIILIIILETKEEKWK